MIHEEKDVAPLHQAATPLLSPPTQEITKAVVRKSTQSTTPVLVPEKESEVTIEVSLSPIITIRTKKRRRRKKKKVVISIVVKKIRNIVVIVNQRAKKAKVTTLQLQIVEMRI